MEKAPVRAVPVSPPMHFLRAGTLVATVLVSQSCAALEAFRAKIETQPTTAMPDVPPSSEVKPQTEIPVDEFVTQLIEEAVAGSREPLLQLAREADPRMPSALNDLELRYISAKSSGAGNAAAILDLRTGVRREYSASLAKLSLPSVPDANGKFASIDPARVAPPNLWVSVVSGAQLSQKVKEFGFHDWKLGSRTREFSTDNGVDVKLDGQAFLKITSSKGTQYEIHCAYAAGKLKLWLRTQDRINKILSRSVDGASASFPWYDRVHDVALPDGSVVRLSVARTDIAPAYPQRSVHSGFGGDR